MIKCKDQCGRSVLDEQGAMQEGWSWLCITGSWRCGICSRELSRASSMIGTEPGAFIDAVPPTSRGALPKSTSESITPPIVPSDPKD